MKVVILNDNGREYDLEKIDSYSLNTQKLITRLIHLRYTQIVKVLSNTSETKMNLSEVKKALESKDVANRIKSTFGYTLEEINFYIDYADQNIPMVR